MIIGAISDIPKIYTALAEWLTSFLYIIVVNGNIAYKKKNLFWIVGMLVLLIPLQILIGDLPDILWIPGMMIAVGLMFLMLCYGGEMNRLSAGYYLVRAFVAAEMMASLEWQLYYYFSEKYQWEASWLKEVFMIVIYSIVLGVIYFIEQKHAGKKFEIAKKEVWMAVSIGVCTFLMSNLSYVFSNTPFSSSIGREVFNIRTLIGMGGFIFLYAYHYQRCEDHTEAELDAIQNILHNQYIQYRQSRENIETINHKYHDLKHQIAVLRNESNLEKRDEYLDEMEKAITQYEMQFRTGNNVLDTILTSKGMLCSRNGIAFTCVAEGRLLDKMYVMDICTIFGNALDNAIECEMKIPEKEKRLIHLSVSRMDEFLFIRIENYLEELPDFQNGLPVTTKSDKAYHGFGVKSIQYSAAKYNGTVTFGVEENWFELKILIPLQNVAGKSKMEKNKTDSEIR